MMGLFLYLLMFSPVDDFILKIITKIVKIITVTGYADNQVAV